MQRIEPARQRRLEQVRRVHRPAAGRARADHRVDFIDEQHRLRQLFELVDDLLQPLLEIAAIARARQQRAHVERIDHRLEQHIGHLALDDLARQPFGDRGLADAGIADIKRVVLAAAAQDLDRPVDLGPAADQRIDLAVLRLLVEVDGELLERGFLLALVLGRFLGRAPRRRPWANPASICLPPLPIAVADEADGIEPAHVLLLQEIDRIALALGKQRHQHIGAGDGRRLPDDWTCRIARWTTRWNPAVGWGSASSSDLSDWYS
jgi:hypothetical protein